MLSFPYILALGSLFYILAGTFKIQSRSFFSCSLVILLKVLHRVEKPVSSLLSFSGLFA